LQKEEFIDGNKVSVRGMKKAKKDQKYWGVFL
jgi:hypothetical protein